MLYFIDKRQISIFEYCFLMNWAQMAMHFIRPMPDTVVETKHFIMDVLGGPVYKY